MTCAALPLEVAFAHLPKLKFVVSSRFGRSIRLPSGDPHSEPVRFLRVIAEPRSPCSDVIKQSRRRDPRIGPRSKRLNETTSVQVQQCGPEPWAAARAVSGIDRPRELAPGAARARRLPNSSGSHGAWSKFPGPGRGAPAANGAGSRRVRQRRSAAPVARRRPWHADDVFKGDNPQVDLLLTPAFPRRRGVSLGGP